MKKRFMDDEEKELVAAYEAGEFKPVKNQSEEKGAAVRAARRYILDPAHSGLPGGRQTPC